MIDDILLVCTKCDPPRETNFLFGIYLGSATAQLQTERFQKTLKLSGNTRSWYHQMRISCYIPSTQTILFCKRMYNTL